jgi:tol-pal system protein YbgF
MRDISKQLFIFFSIASLCTGIGCVTTDEMSRINTQIENLYQEVAILKGQVAAEVPQTRADMETTIEDLHREIEVLRANVEDNSQRLNRLTDEVQMVKLGAQSSAESAQTEPAQVGTPPTTGTEAVPRVAAAAPPPPTAGTEEIHSATLEGMYQQAYDAFKAEDYPGALTMFRDFLNKYPDSEYSDNAQYWIGECYYQQIDYERAILEYEKLLRRYPKGDKVPAALLKQGFAFLNLGDKVDAELLFKQVIKKYPHSPQAQIANRKLQTLK